MAGSIYSPCQEGGHLITDTILNFLGKTFTKGLGEGLLAHTMPALVVRGLVIPDPHLFPTGKTLPTAKETISLQE